MSKTVLEKKGWTYKQFSPMGQQAKTYIHQLCADSGYHLEDLPGVMTYRIRLRESQGNFCYWLTLIMTMMIYIYIYIYIYKYSTKCKQTKINAYGLILELTLSRWLGQGVCHQLDVKLGGFLSLLGASHVSSYTEELWYNETVSLWMTIYIYM